IQDGLIEAVGEELSVPQAVRSIDCAGKFAVPGLFDSHTHLSMLTLRSDEQVRSVFSDFVRRGVTQVRDVGGPLDVIGALSRRTDSEALVGPEIFYTGPMLEQNPLTWADRNVILPGFTVAIDTPADVDRVLQELNLDGAQLVKTFGRIDKQTYQYLLQEAERLSLRVVHDPGGLFFHRIPMDEALDWGVTSIEHAKAPWPVVLRDDLREEHDRLLAQNADQATQTNFNMRMLSLGLASISSERVNWLADKMYEKNAYLCPTLYVFEFMNNAVMEEVGEYFVRELAARGVRMLVGQDGTNPDGVFNEMLRLRECGLSEVEILRGATIYPAQWLRVEDRLGAIAPGRQANLIAVDADPLADIANMKQVHLVVHRGRIIDQ
ncbi:MAG: amidohydrolase family protein, partial [Desulfatitalea sp.]|nr:amidohydrolase family protein [Desulfatitalea sp.]NNK02355.1 amidohydrolase family protein [Desulfatitalea sp.]